MALRRVAKLISESIEVIDWKRNIEVRSQIDRKMLEQLRPQDLFYQILHGLRSLTHYDHSSAILICDHVGKTLEVVAEQIAWLQREKPPNRTETALERRDLGSCSTRIWFTDSTGAMPAGRNGRTGVKPASGTAGLQRASQSLGFRSAGILHAVRAARHARGRSGRFESRRMLSGFVQRAMRPTWFNGSRR